MKRKIFGMYISRKKNHESKFGSKKLNPRDVGKDRVQQGILTAMVIAVVVLSEIDHLPLIDT